MPLVLYYGLLDFRLFPVLQKMPDGDNEPEEPEKTVRKSPFAPYVVTTHHEKDK